MRSLLIILVSVFFISSSIPISFRTKSNVLVSNNELYVDNLNIMKIIKVLDIKNCNISITRINLEFLKVEAFTKHYKSNYFILINKKSEIRFIDILCHEFIHIKQYQDGRLQVNGNIATFDGKEYDMLEVDYNDRPWEIEAIKEGRKLRSALRRLE